MQPEFGNQPLCVVNFLEHLGDAGGMNGDGARQSVGVTIVQHERLDIAVEDDTHEFASAIHHGTSRVSANNIGGVDEIQRRREIQCALIARPAGR